MRTVRKIVTFVNRLVVLFVALVFSILCVNILVSMNEAFGEEIKQDNYRHLLDAICKVESNCQSDAVGDNGKAIGAYQIWYDYWYDAVTFSDDDDLKLSDGYESCYDKDYSEKLMLVYWERFATMKRLGRVPTDEDRARIHNGGPNGYKKEATITYWSKVRKELDE